MAGRHRRAAAAPGRGAAPAGRGRGDSTPEPDAEPVIGLPGARSPERRRPWRPRSVGAGMRSGIAGVRVVVAWLCGATLGAAAVAVGPGPASTPPSRRRPARRSTSRSCATCHGDDLGGDRAGAGAGRPRSSSSRGTARICGGCSIASTTMPPAAPKSLSAADAVAVLAFLLRASEMPSGPRRCRPIARSLAEITFERSSREQAGGSRNAVPALAGCDRQSAPAHAGAARAGAPAPASRTEHRLADLRRQPGEPSLLAGRPDHQGQLQPAARSPGG